MRVNKININTIEETYLLVSNDFEIFTDDYVSKRKNTLRC